MFKRVVQSVVLFAVISITYLLYSAAVADGDKSAAPKQEPDAAKEQATVKTVETAPATAAVIRKAATTQKSEEPAAKRAESAVDNVAEPTVQKVVPAKVKPVMESNEKAEPALPVKGVSKAIGSEPNTGVSSREPRRKTDAETDLTPAADVKMHETVRTVETPPADAVVIRQEPAPEREESAVDEAAEPTVQNVLPVEVKKGIDNDEKAEPALPVKGVSKAIGSEPNTEVSSPEPRRETGTKTDFATAVDAKMDEAEHIEGAVIKEEPSGVEKDPAPTAVIPETAAVQNSESKVRIEEEELFVAVAPTAERSAAAVVEPTAEKRAVTAESSAVEDAGKVDGPPELTVTFPTEADVASEEVTAGVPITETVVAAMPIVAEPEVVQASSVAMAEDVHNVSLIAADPIVGDGTVSSDNEKEKNIAVEHKTVANEKKPEAQTVPAPLFEEEEHEVVPAVIAAVEPVTVPVVTVPKEEPARTSAAALTKSAMPEEVDDEQSIVTAAASQVEEVAPLIVQEAEVVEEAAPKARTKEDEKAARRAYQNYGKKAVSEPQKTEESELLLHQHAGYSIRNRKGTEGVDKLDTSKMSFALGVGSGRSHYTLGLDMVQLRSGRLKTENYTLYGSDGAVAVNTPSDSEGGEALNLGYRYEHENFAVSGLLGMTPNVGNGIAVAPLFAIMVESYYDLWKTYGRIIQSAVTDSLLSSVGNQDPYTEQVWGRVVKQGLEGGLSFGDRYKIAMDLGYYPVIKGENTLENSELTATLRVVKAMQIPHVDNLDVGLLFVYDDYTFNSDHFTFGHGGYFSPQSYYNGGVMLDMTERFSGNLLFDARGSVGYTTYQTDAVLKYPLENGVQTYAAGTEKFIGADATAFLGMQLSDTAQVIAAAGYQNHTGTDEYFIHIALQMYLQKHRMTRKDFVSVDLFSSGS